MYFLSCEEIKTIIIIILLLFYGNCSILNSHTNTVISHTFAYSSTRQDGVENRDKRLLNVKVKMMFFTSLNDKKLKSKQKSKSGGV